MLRMSTGKAAEAASGNPAETPSSLAACNPADKRGRLATRTHVTKHEGAAAGKPAEKCSKLAARKPAGKRGSSPPGNAAAKRSSSSAGQAAETRSASATRQPAKERSKSASGKPAEEHDTLAACKPAGNSGSSAPCMSGEQRSSSATHKPAQRRNSLAPSRAGKKRSLLAARKPAKKRSNMALLMSTTQRNSSAAHKRAGQSSIVAAHKPAEQSDRPAPRTPAEKPAASAARKPAQKRSRSVAASAAAAPTPAKRRHTQGARPAPGSASRRKAATAVVQADPLADPVAPAPATLTVPAALPSEPERPSVPHADTTLVGTKGAGQSGFQPLSSVSTAHPMAPVLGGLPVNPFNLARAAAEQATAWQHMPAVQRASAVKRLPQTRRRLGAGHEWRVRRRAAPPINAESTPIIVVSLAARAAREQHAAETASEGTAEPSGRQSDQKTAAPQQEPLLDTEGRASADGAEPQMPAAMSNSDEGGAAAAAGSEAGQKRAACLPSSPPADDGRDEERISHEPGGQPALQPVSAPDVVFLHMPVVSKSDPGRCTKAQDAAPVLEHAACREGAPPVDVGPAALKRARQPAQRRSRKAGKQPRPAAAHIAQTRFSAAAAALAPASALGSQDAGDVPAAGPMAGGAPAAEGGDAAQRTASQWWSLAHADGAGEAPASARRLSAPEQAAARAGCYWLHPPWLADHPPQPHLQVVEVLPGTAASSRAAQAVCHDSWLELRSSRWCICSGRA